MIVAELFSVRNKNMKKILAILLVLCCVLPAVAKKRQNEEIITPLTQLEKRQFQTKTFPVQDNMLVMKAILNVLQDEGFLVYNVNSLLGYIYGVKDFDLSDPNIDVSKEFGVTKSRLNYNGVKVATLEVGVNVMQYGQNSRVRVNFKRKLLNEYGNAQMIEDISDIQYYDDFYAKVNTAINIQKQIQEKIKKETPVTVKKMLPKMKDPAEDTKQIENAETLEESPEIKLNEQNTTESVSTPDIPVIEATRQEFSSEPIEVPEDVKVAPSSQEETKTQPEDEKVETAKQESKELKKQLKQEKQDAKQAQKDAKIAQKQSAKELKQAQKDAKIAQKEAEKEYKQAQKEERKAAKRQAKENKK